MSSQFVLSRFDAPHFATLHETSLLQYIFKYMKRLNFTVRTKVLRTKNFVERGAASTAPIRSYLNKISYFGAYFHRITLVCKDQQQTARQRHFIFLYIKFIYKNYGSSL